LSEIKSHVLGFEKFDFACYWLIYIFVQKFYNTYRWIQGMKIETDWEWISDIQGSIGTHKTLNLVSFFNNYFKKCLSSLYTSVGKGVDILSLLRD
jgi:hypothetical protein